MKILMYLIMAKQELDGWTIKTDDGKPSAHYEHTILVTKDGYEILTPRIDGDD